MKPKISIRRWDLAESKWPIGLQLAVLPVWGYQVLCNGVAVAKSSDKNEIRRIAYHLRTKWNK